MRNPGDVPVRDPVSKTRWKASEEHHLRLTFGLYAHAHTFMLIHMFILT